MSTEESQSQSVPALSTGCRRCGSVLPTDTTRSATVECPRCHTVTTAEVLDE